MEGPSLRLAKEQLQPFKKKKIITVSGNTKISKERLEDKEVKDIFSWGKHLLFQFDDFAMQVHFMLFGTFEAVIEGQAVTGDYKRTAVPRLQLTFENGTISMFNCSITFVEDAKIKNQYDFTTDIMSTKWDSNQAYKKAKEEKNEEIADLLLDQEIFSGVGNIIKNEVLSITKVNPEELVQNIPDKKLKEIVHTAHSYSKQFYAWRKKFVLTKNLKIHRRALCPHCGNKVTHQKTGKRARWSHFCPLCQMLSM